VLYCDCSGLQSVQVSKSEPCFEVGETGWCPQMRQLQYNREPLLEYWIPLWPYFSYMTLLHSLPSFHVLSFFITYILHNVSPDHGLTKSNIFYLLWNCICVCGTQLLFSLSKYWASNPNIRTSHFNLQIAFKYKLTKISQPWILIIIHLILQG
jgi:hypothetical protein